MRRRCHQRRPDCRERKAPTRLTCNRGKHREPSDPPHCAIWTRCANCAPGGHPGLLFALTHARACSRSPTRNRECKTSTPDQAPWGASVEQHEERFPTPLLKGSSMIDVKISVRISPRRTQDLDSSLIATEIELGDCIIPIVVPGECTRRRLAAQPKTAPSHQPSPRLDGADHCLDDYPLSLRHRWYFRPCYAA